MDEDISMKTIIANHFSIRKIWMDIIIIYRNVEESGIIRLEEKNVEEWIIRQSHAASVDPQHNRKIP